MVNTRLLALTALGGAALVAMSCVQPESTVGPMAPSNERAGEVLATTIRAAGIPVGNFRTQPAADTDDIIRVGVGNSVEINGSRFTSSNPDDQLKLEVEWGDGGSSATGCGPCRVDHVYRPGRYQLTATIHDRRVLDRGSAMQVFTVVVQGPGEPFPPPVGLMSNAGQFAGTTPFKVCRADERTAWLSVGANSSSRYNGIIACQSIGYTDVDAYGGNCGSVCGRCGTPGLESYDGSAIGPTNLGFTVDWRCVR